jgi:hypothetical protein
MSIDQLSPVGSFWRRDGLRRIVTSISHYGTPEDGGTDIDIITLHPDGTWSNSFMSLQNWLAWQANAERIDKEKT